MTSKLIPGTIGSPPSGVIRRRVFSATIANWTGQIVSLVIAFFLAPFILYHIGDTQFGIFTLVGSVVSQGTNLDLGIRAALIKFVAEHHARRDINHLRSIVATSFWLYFSLGLIAFALTAVISPLLPILFKVPATERSTMETVAFLMGINLAISIPFSTPGAVLAGLQKYSQINAISVAWAAVSAITTISILLTGGGLVEVVAAAIPITLVMEAITAICVYRLAPDLHLSWRGARRDLIREVFSFSASVLVMNISYSLQAKSDEIVIGAFLPVSAVSPYSLARRLSSLPQLFAERFLWAFLPLSSQLKAEGEAELLKALYLTGTRITLAICLPLAAVIITMAGPLLTLWIGERFSAYAPIVVILTLASVLQVSSWPGGTILQGLARHHGLAAMSACATVATICLSIVLVRPYGLLGVAIGTLLPTTILIFGWKMSYSMRVLNVTLRELLIQSLLPVLWPSLLMTFLLIGLRWVAGPLGWLTVGFIAATCLSVFGVVYLWFFSGESERQLVLKAFAAVTPSSGAAK